MTRPRLHLRDLPRWLAAHPGVLAIAFLWLTLVWGTLLTVQGAPLNEVAPHGILTYELAPAGPATLEPAPTCPETKAALKQLDHPTLADHLAATETCCLTPTLIAQLRLDFVFIPFYVGLALTLLALLLRRLHQWPPGSRRRRVLLPWTRLAVALAPLAGLLDVLENLALLHQLRAAPTATLAWTPLYAKAKFALLAIVIVGMAATWFATRNQTHTAALSFPTPRA